MTIYDETTQQEFELLDVNETIDQLKERLAESLGFNINYVDLCSEGMIIDDIEYFFEGDKPFRFELKSKYRELLNTFEEDSIERALQKARETH